MTAGTPEADRRIPWVALALVVLALASTLTGLPNQWVQDDLPIIATNKLVHTLAAPWNFFAQSYWPDPFPRELYRPVTMLSFAVQWTMGGGSPLPFRIVSILLYVACTLAVFRLAVRLLPVGWAAVVAALFAVHPVHVEAVAVAVNQAELLVALLLTGLVTYYVDWRRRDGALTTRQMALFVGAYAVAGLTKENGLMLPGLLMLAELTVVGHHETWRTRLVQLRPMLVWMAFAAVLVLAARNIVLAGDVKGTFTAEALFGLGIGQRALTMLGVIPEWFRLLYWPAHLRADYSPQEFVASTGMGPRELLGLTMLCAYAVAAWQLRRTAPLVTFAIGWMAIGIFPVSNVLVPTGILIAERTLFLPSIGAMLLGVAVVHPVVAGLLRRGWGWRAALGGALGALLVMGVTRSASRQRVWHDLVTLWQQTLVDAPKSYRAHHAYAQILFDAGQKGEAEQYYRDALDLYPGAWPIYVDLADKYRLAGECYPAIELYETMLAINPSHIAGRGSLLACLMHIGDYARAIPVAEEGIELGREVDSFTRYAAQAREALRTGAAPGSVILTAPEEPEPNRTP